MSSLPPSSPKPGRKYDLEERLLGFASAVIAAVESLPSTKAVSHIGGQLLRSGTSPYGNHGEAQEPESHDDFIHKLKLCLKELRETRRWARLIARQAWLPESSPLPFILREVEELIRIFKASIRTAQQTRARQQAKVSKPATGQLQPSQSSKF